MAASALPLSWNVARFYRDYDLRTLGCPFCWQHEETYEHLFLGGSVSSIAWWSGPWPIKTEGFASSPISQWLKFLLNKKNLPDHDQDNWSLMMLAVAITLDSLWCMRNCIVHEGKSLVLEDLIQSIRRRFEDHRRVWAQEDENVVMGWQPPSVGALKINFYVSVRMNSLCVAAVCRNFKRSIFAYLDTEISWISPSER